MKYKIRDLAVISDRNTGAVIHKMGDICWYCPESYDGPSVFASLLDEEQGGGWYLELKNKYRLSRKYQANSSILESSFQSDDDSFTLTDWMPLHDDFTGICRMFSPSSFPRTNKIIAAPEYGGEKVFIEKNNEYSVTINKKYYFLFSHPYRINDHELKFDIPPGEEGWAVMADRIPSTDGSGMISSSLDRTRQEWEKITSASAYGGPYKSELMDSLRAIRMLTHEKSGGIIAALTTSLPEVPGGERNYDYRFVWLRDASMIVSALTRAGIRGGDEKHFLDFICSTRKNIEDYSRTPFVSVDKKAATSEWYPGLTGYMNSRPVRVGNNANRQLQLDAGSNILLAAKLIYGSTGDRIHWETIAEIADFLAVNWQKDDHGIWEEDIARQFTSSKVIMAVALEFISEYSESEKQKKYWQETAAAIRGFVDKECLTTSGSYAVFAGSHEVDITAALFPEWDFCDAGTPEMLQTIKELEAHFCEDDLVYRNLLLFDEKKEGAFLAANFWMAQYWIMCNDELKSKRYIDAALRYSNDLGLFSEEASPGTDIMLGNFPQSFVHASFIGAAIDYNNAFGDDSAK